MDTNTHMDISRHIGMDPGRHGHTHRHTQTMADTWTNTEMDTETRTWDRHIDRPTVTHTNTGRYMDRHRCRQTDAH